ncbi:FAD binding domain-containing protein [Clostridium lacusfryxellense]|uniref:FAD binding domain-containing protein n=1 Tax=Clostridium lacusfryxellense TaxID=205328 RepID=UPI001C0BAC93|nr:FAD binding domain-containing protein [Clostridium lacusfryxellense]MBU3113444.1 FAD binding domain-containing protein [Clostridium lacusfryxellense]
MVETFAAKSKEEVLRLLNNRKCIILAGGTDLMVKRKSWPGCLPYFDNDVVFIGHLQELRNIKINENYLVIGAACSLSQIQENVLMPFYFKEVIISMANPAIRNIATIGGNICNASPAGDIFPLLYALDSILVIERLGSLREVKVKDFVLGPGEKDLRIEELLVEIRVPVNKFKSFYYKKVGTRKSTAISKASFIGMYDLEDEKIKDIRMTFGAVGPMVVRSKKLEDKLKGLNKEGLKNILEDIKEDYSKIIVPIDDQRSTAEYRKVVCLNLMEDFLKSIFTEM